MCTDECQFLSALTQLAACFELSATAPTLNDPRRRYPRCAPDLRRHPEAFESAGGGRANGWGESSNKFKFFAKEKGMCSVGFCNKRERLAEIGDLASSLVSDLVPVNCTASASDRRRTVWIDVSALKPSHGVSPTCRAYFAGQDTFDLSAVRCVQENKRGASSY